MKTLPTLFLLTILAMWPGLGVAGPDQATAPAPAAKADAKSIEAKVIAVNRNFGFLIVDAGSKKGVTVGMDVLILREKKWVPGILIIGEVEEDTSVLEYVKGKSDPRDKIESVRFRRSKLKAR